jgi:hypothetical protein
LQPDQKVRSSSTLDGDLDRVSENKQGTIMKPASPSLSSAAAKRLQNKNKNVPVVLPLPTIISPAKKDQNLPSEPGAIPVLDKSEETKEDNVDTNKHT